MVEVVAVVAAEAGAEAAVAAEAAAAAVAAAAGCFVVVAGFELDPFWSVCVHIFRSSTFQQEQLFKIRTIISYKSSEKN